MLTGCSILSGSSCNWCGRDAGFSLRILIAGERGVTLQENIVNETPHLNKK